jgi:hypothetical protein
MEAHHASNILWQLHLGRQHPDFDRRGLCNEKQTDKQTEPIGTYHNANRRKWAFLLATDLSLKCISIIRSARILCDQMDLGVTCTDWSA